MICGAQGLTGLHSPRIVSTVKLDKRMSTEFVVRILLMIGEEDSGTSFGESMHLVGSGFSIFGIYGYGRRLHDDEENATFFLLLSLLFFPLDSPFPFLFFLFSLQISFVTGVFSSFFASSMFTLNPLRIKGRGRYFCM